LPITSQKEALLIKSFSNIAGASQDTGLLEVVIRSEILPWRYFWALLRDPVGLRSRTSTGASWYSQALHQGCSS